MIRQLGRLPISVIGASLLLAGLMLLALSLSLLSRFSVSPAPAASVHGTPTQTRGVSLLLPTFTSRPTLTPVTPTRPAPTRTMTAPTPLRIATRLVVPSLGIDAAVVEVPIVDGRWDVSIIEHEVGHLEATAGAGEKGNMVLAGHVTLRSGGGPFLHLYKLQPGDIAIVYAGSERYEYRVVAEKQVSPDDLSVVEPTLDPTLTLLTCSDWDAENRTYRQRFVVTAALTSQETPSIRLTEPGLEPLRD